MPILLKQKDQKLVIEFKSEETLKRIAHYKEKAEKIRALAQALGILKDDSDPTKKKIDPIRVAEIMGRSVVHTI